MTLTATDIATIASPTLIVGGWILKSLRDSRLKREEEHHEGQASLAALKDLFHEFKDDLGNRVTAVEVALEHVVFPAWRAHNERHDDKR